MYIIKIIANENGGRPPIQTWGGNTPPKGYAVCPEEFREVFYSTDPAGFVNITEENGVVTSMEINQEALEAYIAKNPKSDPIELEPSTDEVLNTLLGVTA